MLVYIVEIECPPRSRGKAKFFRFAVRTDNEVLAVTTVSNRLGLHIDMVASCALADSQDEYLHVKPYAPTLTFAPGD